MHRARWPSADEITALSGRDEGAMQAMAHVTEALNAIRVLCPAPVPLTTATHDAALRIAAKYGFSFYDALIAAAALEAECAILYSEDLQDGQVIEERLTVHNPFAH